MLCAGECAGFKGGDPNRHCLQNRGTGDATVLEIGSRIFGEYATYSDIDMKTGPRATDGFSGFRPFEGPIRNDNNGSIPPVWLSIDSDTKR